MAAKSLTRDLIKRLGVALTKTPLIEVAVGGVGLPRSTFYFWKTQAQDIADGNPGRENLSRGDELLLEFLDTIEASRAKVGQKLSDAALKGAMQDPRVAIDILQRMFPDQFAAPARREIVIRQEGGETGTGIALIPTTMLDQDIAQVLAQQQQQAMQLAKTRTKELSDDQATNPN